MVSWANAPYVHFSNSSHLDSLSNNTDPYTIYYGQEAVVSPSKVITYGVLNITGIALLSLLLGTIFYSKLRKTSRSISRSESKIQRDPCLINAFIVLILVSLLNILYWLASEGTITKYEIVYLPHVKLCRAQAILQAGSQSAQVSVVSSVVIRLWLKTISITRPWYDKFRGRKTLIFLLAVPYLCVIGFVPKMVILTNDPKSTLLIPTPFYCSLLDLEIRRSYQILTGVIALFTLLIELWIIQLISSQFRQTSKTSDTAIQSVNASQGVQIDTIHPQRKIKITFYIRVSIFLIWTLGMLFTSLWQAFDSTITDATSDLVFACMGILAFICFATQADILAAWNIPATIPEWRRKFKLDPPIESTPKIPRSRGDRNNHNYNEFDRYYTQDNTKEYPHSQPRFTRPTPTPRGLGLSIELGDFIGNSNQASDVDPWSNRLNLNSDIERGHTLNPGIMPDQHTANLEKVGKSEADHVERIDQVNEEEEVIHLPILDLSGNTITSQHRQGD
ncbi:uncharacterized protein IL334_001570 [Kwoniella shivajii]|uniref:G-protein coupled receptors family 1 profile domain-containing protein n=1 Tax=Kwoniella shivajii TaxID=564305 RepID=A0ABZ1CSJ0_9TREE|nr:hypothetical protein IL334_001570 [Kwoniella shivajii]